MIARLLLVLFFLASPAAVWGQQTMQQAQKKKKRQRDNRWTDQFGAAIGIGRHQFGASLQWYRLYALGENVHIAVWPGSDSNTRDITRFIAKESRSYVLSVSGLMSRNDLPKDTPHLDKILQNAPPILANGGSCIAAPDGEWIVPPVLDKEGLITAILDVNQVFEERQNFDPSGHYSRPDVTQLIVNRERQSVLKFTKEQSN